MDSLGVPNRDVGDSDCHIFCECPRRGQPSAAHCPGLGAERRGPRTSSGDDCAEPRRGSGPSADPTEVEQQVEPGREACALPPQEAPGQVVGGQRGREVGWGVSAGVQSRSLRAREPEELWCPRPGL